jgi:hypothetical protein
MFGFQDHPSAFEDTPDSWVEFSGDFRFRFPNRPQNRRHIQRRNLIHGPREQWGAIAWPEVTSPLIFYLFIRGLRRAPRTIPPTLMKCPIVTSAATQLSAFGMRGSMSRKGNCWDNNAVRQNILLVS